MPRVKRGVTSHRRHKKILSLTKGHKGVRSKLIRRAKESALHAGAYAFAGRKQRRREFRRLWIIQLNAALRNEGLTYSRFMAAVKTKNIALNRKSLAELAVHDLETFKKIIAQVTQ